MVTVVLYFTKLVYSLLSNASAKYFCCIYNIYHILKCTSIDLANILKKPWYGKTVISYYLYKSFKNIILGKLIYMTDVKPLFVLEMNLL